MSLTEQSWHLDRRVPAILILAIILQSAGVLIWAGQMTQRIDHLEREITLIETINERTARLEENISFMRAGLMRLERKIDLLHAAATTGSKR